MHPLSHHPIHTHALTLFLPFSPSPIQSPFPPQNNKQFPGTVTVTPNLNFGPGGVYMINQPPQMQVSFRPADNFFPVGRCLALSTSATAGGGELPLTNNGPQQQQACVEGNVEPYAQPAPVMYTVAATVSPATTFECTSPNMQKTYTVAASATGTPLGTGASQVTAAADPAVELTVQCPAAAAAATQAVSLQQQGADAAPASLSVSVGGFETTIASEYAWTIVKTLNASAAGGGDGDSVVGSSGGGDAFMTMAVNELPRTVAYTVRVARAAAPADARHYVAGKVTVLNTGAKAVPVDAVYVTAGAAAVRADCPGDKSAAGGGGGGGVLMAEPNVNLVCAFNVTWNRGAVPGALGARVDTPDDGQFFAPPAGFDWDAAARPPPRGERALVFDDLVAAPPPGVMPPSQPWYALGDTPLPARGEGVTLTAEGGREYAYELRVGPFVTATACGNYTLTNTAAAEPAGAPPSAAVKAAATLTVEVTGCAGGAAALQSTTAAGGAAGVDAAVEGVKTARVAGAEWTVATAATPAALEVPYDKTGTATFTVKFGKKATTKLTVSGSVRVSNAALNGGAVEVARVQVALLQQQGDGGEGTAPAAPKTVDAVCAGKSMPFTVSTGGEKGVT